VDLADRDWKERSGNFAKNAQFSGIALHWILRHGDDRNKKPEGTTFLLLTSA
jgi:hypothetical protein